VIHTVRPVLYHRFSGIASFLEQEALADVGSSRNYITAGSICIVMHTCGMLAAFLISGGRVVIPLATGRGWLQTSLMASLGLQSELVPYPLRT
jgi:hypothetical protein